MVLLQKGFHSNEAYIEFINLAFGMQERGITFPVLLPKLYGDKADSRDVTYFAVEDNSILGTVGAFPLTFVIGGERFNVRGIGSVATHPERRGEGYMKALMKKAIDDMIADDIDFSVLGGRRHRYNYFGFEKCDGMAHFSLTEKTVSYVRPKVEGLSVRHVSPEDTELLDLLFEKMHKRPYYTLRPREALHDILSSWYAFPVAFFEGDSLVGWAVYDGSKRRLLEFIPLDLSRADGMLALAVETFGALSVTHPAYDTTLAEIIDPLCENVDLVSEECFLVFNWKKLLSRLFSLLSESKKLVDGSLTVTVQGVKGDVTLCISVRNGKTSVEETAVPAEITLSTVEAESFFFRNVSPLRAKVNPHAASWLPLPLFIYEPDNV